MKPEYPKHESVICDRSVHDAHGVNDYGIVFVNLSLPFQNQAILEEGPFCT